jgi:hypothetical protein
MEDNGRGCSFITTNRHGWFVEKQEDISVNMLCENSIEVYREDWHTTLFPNLKMPATTFRAGPFIQKDYIKYF